MGPDAERVNLVLYVLLFLLPGKRRVVLGTVDHFRLDTVGQNFLQIGCTPLKKPRFSKAHFGPVRSEGIFTSHRTVYGAGDTSDSQNFPPNLH